MTRKFTARIKERGSNHYLTPVFVGDENTTMDFVEKFFGVHEPDVVDYTITVEEY